MAELCACALAAVVEIVSCVVVALVPSGVTLCGVNVHCASDGSPLQLNANGEVNPFTGVIVSVAVPDCPLTTFRVFGLTPTVKSAGGGGFTVTVTAVEADAVKEVSPPYCAVMELAPTGKAVVE